MSALSTKKRGNRLHKVKITFPHLGAKKSFTPIMKQYFRKKMIKKYSAIQLFK